MCNSALVCTKSHRIDSNAITDSILTADNLLNRMYNETQRARLIALNYDWFCLLLAKRNQY